MNEQTMIEKVKKTFVLTKEKRKTNLDKVAEKLKKDAAKKKTGFFDGRNIPDETPPTTRADKKEGN